MKKKFIIYITNIVNIFDKSLNKTFEMDLDVITDLKKILKTVLIDEHIKYIMNPSF